MKNKDCNKVEDLLRDDGFINYTLGASDSDIVQDWDSLSLDDPKMKTFVEQAKEIFLAPSNVECDLDNSEAQLLKERILHSVGLLKED